MGIQLKRATSIAQILSEEGLGFVAARFGLGQGSSEELTGLQKAELPARVRRLCERLGPMFIKFGQLLSTRSDLVPEEFCVELAKLQANVAPFDNKTAKQIIENELGRPVAEVFARIDDLPMAAASIAQVYGAELLDGSKVVLKVQRPNAVDQVTSDVELLLWMSRQLHRLIPQYRAQQVHLIAEEFAHGARKELDFLNEADAAGRFAEHLKNDPVVRIPKVYRPLCTAALIVMERLDGKRLDQVPDGETARKFGMDPNLLTDTIMRSIMEQTLVHGLVHADLHPGNMFILPDAKLGFIDFGMHGELSRDLQTSLIRIMMHRSNNRHEECADALLEVYSRNPGADAEGFRNAAIAMGKKLESSTLSEYTIGQSMVDEGKVAAKYGFVAPGGLLMFGRALLVTEGFVVRFNPEANIPDKMRPIIQRIVLKRFDFQRITETMQSLMPEIMQQLENAPKVLRQLMSIERRFANAKSPDDLIADVFGSAAATTGRRASSSFGPWLVASVLWAAAAAAALLPAPAGTPLVAGVPWFALVAVTAALAMTTALVIKRL